MRDKYLNTFQLFRKMFNPNRPRITDWQTVQALQIQFETVTAGIKKPFMQIRR